MSGGQNLASKYSKKVDERFHLESQAMLALNNDYEFKGDKTVKVYSIPIVAMNDYSRAGAARYGSPSDLGRSVQTLTVSRDRAFTFIIDKGDKLQSEMVSDAGKALARQLREVVVPEFDSYVFSRLAAAAVQNGAYDSAALTKANAYEHFLKGMEWMGDHNVPDKGRVAFCSYRFANLLKQDSAFMRYSDLSQELILRGVIGEVDGCRIVKVPSNRLPAGAAFIITHSIAATAPKQLEEYKIHDNPPGISGYLVEGRFIYDCFVLNEKADGVYYHDGQSILKALNVITAPASARKCIVIVNGSKELSTNKWYYLSAASAAELPALAPSSSGDPWYGAAELSVNSASITPAAGHSVIRVVEVDGGTLMLVSFGDALLNVGL